MVNNYINVCLLLTVNIGLQLILLSEGNFFLMIGSMEVTHEITFTIPSVIQLTQLTQLRFNLGKPQIAHLSSGVSNT